VNEKLGGNFFDWRQEVTAFFAPSAQRNNKQAALTARAAGAGEADTAMGLLHSSHLQSYHIS
jgi:hypothetical protein